MSVVGLDVHRHRTQVAVLQEDGKELGNRRASNASGKLTEVLGSLEPGTSVVLEATYGWSWVVDPVEELGLEAHLAHPGGCKAIAFARLKNDRVDARTLAHLLRTDLLPEAWIPPREVRELRDLLRHRVGLVRLRTMIKSRVRAVLATQGVAAPAERWGRPGRRWLASLAGR